MRRVSGRTGFDVLSMAVCRLEDAMKTMLNWRTAEREAGFDG